jgi:hypothetical protein
MSMDPGMISQMLAQKLGQPTQGGMVGQQQPQQQPQVVPNTGAASLVQKLMLMQALKNAPQMPGGATGRQQAQATGMVPGTNAMIGANPAMQALQQPPQMQPPLQPPPIADPNALPIPGVS